MTYKVLYYLGTFTLGGAFVELTLGLHYQALAMVVIAGLAFSVGKLFKRFGT